MKLKEEIKQIEKEEARLARKKEALEVKMKKEAELDKKLDDLFKKSGFKTPRALIKALMNKYGVRVNATAASNGNRTRKRTKITPELRDEIKKKVKGGQSMNSVSKEYSISYAVISKIAKGNYDKLK